MDVFFDVLCQLGMQGNRNFLRFNVDGKEWNGMLFIKFEIAQVIMPPIEWDDWHNGLPFVFCFSVFFNILEFRT